jgi:hypothetical protein
VVTTSAILLKFNFTINERSLPKHFLSGYKMVFTIETNSNWGEVKTKLGHSFTASLYKIKDESSKFYVEISNLGATIVRVQVPDKYAFPTTSFNTPEMGIKMTLCGDMNTHKTTLPTRTTLELL